MDITQADLDAVKAALSGTVSPQQIATDYSITQLVLLAHAAFTAAGYASYSWKGELGELLEELTIKGAVPEGGWTDADRTSPAWDLYYYKAQRLVSTSRKLGLHSADKGGNRLVIHPDDRIVALLEDPRCRQAALDIFAAAKAKVDARRAAELDRRVRAQKLKAAIKAKPALSYYFKFLADSGDPALWISEYQELGRLIRTYMPELLQEE